MEEIVFQPLTPSKDQIDVKTAINNKRCNVATQKTDLVFTVGEFYTLFPLRDTPGYSRHNGFYLHRAQLELKTIKRVERPVGCQSHQVEGDDLEL